MEGLVKKGLVTKKNNGPKTFEIVEKKIPKSLMSLPKVDIGSNIFSNINISRRDANIDNIWKKLHKQTKDEFLVFAGDMSWISRREKEIKKMTSKIKYRIIIFKFNKEIIPNIKKGLKTGAEIRFFKNHQKNLRGVISDIKPKDGVQWNKDAAKYFGTFITGGMVPKVFREYFYCLWETSVPIEKLIKK